MQGIPIIGHDGCVITLANQTPETQTPESRPRRWPLVAFLLVLAASQATAQREPVFTSAEEGRAALETAVEQRKHAEARSIRLEREASEAETAAARTRKEAAALAARVQQAEAGIAAAEARIAMIDNERRKLREELGARQGPVVRLTAALQKFSRRPVVLSLLRPGSIRDVVYTRAMLASAVPQVRQRTSGLRARLDRSRRLRREAEQARGVLRAEQEALDERRTELAELETRQRLAARQASGNAARESERALALAEEARDLDGLVGELDRAGSLRDRLAALPGPKLRPERPQDAQVTAPERAAQGTEGIRTRPPSPYLLPVAGRTVTGFGAPSSGGLSNGLTIAPRGGAQVIAPAQGRVVFAAPYEGYGRIVIVEHEGGWTSVVMGLARVDVNVGDEVTGGSPLGIAPQGRPTISLELRREGEPVNPVPFLG
ncbi:murein hydrolase activator EnvC family protein [Paraurantiacibacter namhicola]|uniref:Murein hydrolase activator EnvC n=1 Tax=Paraurantiacibacter namhicola TaxID=645517 RepID=A0A1C7D5G3_9SPHN|nr:peptidoglycan DD-metalloendopeptidase family protein [Paraurantiacibacter namhicola]ANU06707.1 Murein hydrolase activator EnvC precursor [Paraurantiacibacter namhicola]